MRSSAIRRNPAESLAHSLLVRLTADEIRRMRPRATVQADAAGYPQPDTIYWQGETEGHRPDVLGGGFIVEVETASSLRGSHAKSQLELFAAYAKTNNLTLVLAVPTSAQHDARARLAELGIAGDVWHA